VKAEFQVPVTKKIKQLDRKIDKKVNGKIGKHRGSKNRKKLQAQRRRQYAKVKNKKKDTRNKVVSAVTNNFKYVCMQDESISAWKAGKHGKKVQNTGIGGILSDLKRTSRTPIVLSKWFPSTQLCPQCGKRNKLTVKDRVYKCECGYVHDRDIKSAQCIHMEGMKYIVSGVFTA
jgi:putative transposase